MAQMNEGASKLWTAAAEAQAAQAAGGEAAPEAAEGGAAPSVALLGEVVSWTMRGTSTRTRMVAALEAAGLDAGLVTEFKTRYAFARACEGLADGRIIRKVGESADDLHFQFTAERRAGEAATAPAEAAQPQPAGGPEAPATPEARYDYRFETILTLKKATGEIVCDKPDLVAQARQLLEDAREKRTANDATCVIQRLFAQRARTSLTGDLWPIREQGAVYFVMASQVPFVAQVEKFVEALGGTMSRFPIPAGTATGGKTVAEVVSRGLGGLIAEMEAHVEAFGEKTMTGTMDRAALNIARTQEKILAYSEYLGAQQEALQEQLAAVRAKLAAKIEGMADDDGPLGGGGDAQGADGPEAGPEDGPEADPEDGPQAQASGPEAGPAGGEMALAGAA